MRKIINEIKKKSITELENETVNLRNELAKLKLESAVNQVKDTNIIMKKRKELAVVLTILGQKKEIEKINNLNETS
ncbi:50S ribosomal protein L29 [Candidatus Roizmanbacteria bacterium RIFCSPHIGHO2_01_FULL_39_12c]|uniref:Large ribosomal subunit protein uL29 n=1 Tax=Candidatus Roizmanbacteria bacterium RIFCSPHIGHO2_01_FULL_39_12c TaxID=1802031 RepID=A0A1F7GEA0_9BACT|nr:MAG: 50S ribosomal protein L29 [Candidatus Roizmanbacteria bacterium RIFCSPHIGHO2_01_FULL_39_12c]OGK47584.1 MAG: 50S ribosomal protein L29 [Candidatus Roizmanbacteria bacterium RIFCSPLOWO2_01_FULL_40_13]